jgi:hypothetical protein
VATPVRKCEKIDCGLPPLDLDGTARLVSSSNESVLFQATANYRCKTGYMRQNALTPDERTFEFTCGDDAQLTGINDCVKITCPSPPEELNAKLITNAFQNFEYQDTVIYGCLPGYQSVQGFASTCGSDGRWEVTGTCERVPDNRDLLTSESEAENPSTVPSFSDSTRVAVAPVVVFIYLILAN